MLYQLKDLIKADIQMNTTNYVCFVNIDFATKKDEYANIEKIYRRDTLKMFKV